MGWHITIHIIFGSLIAATTCGITIELRSLLVFFTFAPTTTFALRPGRSQGGLFSAKREIASQSQGLLRLSYASARPSAAPSLAAPSRA